MFFVKVTIAYYTSADFSSEFICTSYTTYSRYLFFRILANTRTGQNIATTAQVMFLLIEDNKNSSFIGTAYVRCSEILSTTTCAYSGTSPTTEYVYVPNHT
jgi:xanthine/uracil/vitamin C permease (AzgA family)